MALVKGPNGIAFDFADHIAESLVNSPSGEYEYVDAEKPSPKKAAAKPSPKKAAAKPSPKK